MNRLGQIIHKLLKLICYPFNIIGKNPYYRLSDLFYLNTFKIGDFEFVTPNSLTLYRSKTFFTKEKETLEWIDGFEKNSIFLDIGANVGLYSIYASKKKNCKVYSVEPSPLNLKALSRNIYLNKLSNSIFILPFALSNNKNSFSKFIETSISDGGALNSFGVDYDYRGNKILNNTTEFFTYGTTIDDFFENHLKKNFPNYIKIDVDGIEHLIIKGGSNIIQKYVSEILVEVSESFESQKQNIIKSLNEIGFEIVWKKASFQTKNKEDLTLNYLFKKTN
jgi:FkbM family methyltransferase